jgi:dienelactone hydrolase
MYRHYNVEPSVEMAHKGIKELKEQGIEKIGVIGYCWGARLTVRLASQSDKVHNIISLIAKNFPRKFPR